MDSRCLLGKAPCCSHWKVIRGKPILSLTGLWLHALGPSYSLLLLILGLRLQFKRGKGPRSRCKELHLEPHRQGLRQAPQCNETDWFISGRQSFFFYSISLFRCFILFYKYTLRCQKLVIHKQGFNNLL